MGFDTTANERIHWQAPNHRDIRSTKMWSKIFSTVGVLCLLASSPSLRGQGPAVGVDQLQQNSLQEAFRVLQENYIRADELGHDAINRAALGGLLERLEIGAELVTSPPGEEVEDKAATTSFPNVLAKISDNLAYLRLALGAPVPTRKDIAALCDGTDRLILDLRSPDQSDDFARAAEFLELFVPAGELLFQIKKPDGDRGTVYQATAATEELPPILLLIDEATSPAAEVIAASLAPLDNVLVAGATTRGRTVRYASVPIAEGVRIRYAEAEVHLPGGERPYGIGVVPTISLTSDLENKAKSMAAVDPENIEAFLASLKQKERPRLNEAALVAGTNPELPGLVEQARRRQLASEGKGVPTSTDLGQPQVIDVVLRQTVDFLTAADRLELSLD